jgi:glycosyltransferase involved in cell wall biosynthesis
VTFWRNAADVLLARLAGRRVLLHIHGAQFHTFLAGMAPLEASGLRWILARCDRIVVLGQGWKRLMDQWSEPSRVSVVPNGVPLPAPVDPVSPPFQVVCLANYERRKGLMDLVSAVARLRASGRDVRVVLLGAEAESGCRAKLTSQSHQLGIADAVIVFGPAMGAEKEAWLASSSCLCLPSYDEGLPMAMLEAMAAGLPVIVTRVGAVPEAVVDGEEGLLFSPGDVDMLSQHLRTLYDDPQLASRLAGAGRRRVEREFSLDASAHMLQQLYAEVIEDRRATRSV